MVSNNLHLLGHGKP